MTDPAKLKAAASEKKETGVSQGEEIGIVEQRARAPERGHLHPDPSPGRGSGDGQAGQGSYDH